MSNTVSFQFPMPSDEEAREFLAQVLAQSTIAGANAERVVMVRAWLSRATVPAPPEDQADEAVTPVSEE